MILKEFRLLLPGRELGVEAVLPERLEWVAAMPIGDSDVCSVSGK